MSKAGADQMLADFTEAVQQAVAAHWAAGRAVASLDPHGHVVWERPPSHWRLIRASWELVFRRG